jgi:hypothetical protein
MLQNYFRFVLLGNGTDYLSSKESQFFFHNSITKFHYREAMKLQVLGLRA